jgi:hypothetical protein
LRWFRSPQHRRYPSHSQAEGRMWRWEVGVRYSVFPQSFSAWLAGKMWQNPLYFLFRRIFGCNFWIWGRGFSQAGRCVKVCLQWTLRSKESRLIGSSVPRDNWRSLDSYPNRTNGMLHVEQWPMFGRQSKHNLQERWLPSRSCQSHRRSHPLRVHWE